MFLPTTNETGDLRVHLRGLMGFESRTMDVFLGKLIWKTLSIKSLLGDYGTFSIAMSRFFFFFFGLCLSPSDAKKQK